MDALKLMKGGKATSMDDIVLEMLKILDINIVDWLLRIFIRCMEAWVDQIIEEYHVSFRYTRGKVIEGNLQITEE